VAPWCAAGAGPPAEDPERTWWDSGRLQRRKRDRKGEIVRAYGLAAALIAAAVLVAGCAGSGEAKAPSSFTANDESVAKITEEAIDGGTSPGLAKKPPEVNCASGECSITYDLKEPTGISYEQEEILPTRQIWKAMFEDPSIKGAKITVEGPVKSLGGKSETAPIYELECTKEEAQQINWDEVDEHGMTQICRYERKVK